MNPLELLEVAKKIWEASHSVGGEKGDRLLFEMKNINY